MDQKVQSYLPAGLILGTERKTCVWRHLKIRRLRRSENKKQEINGLITSAKYPMAYGLELPPARNAEVPGAEEVVVVVVDAQASRGEAPNNQVPTTDGLFATRIRPGAVAKTPCF